MVRVERKQNVIFFKLFIFASSLCRCFEQKKCILWDNDVCRLSPAWQKHKYTHFDINCSIRCTNYEISGKPFPFATHSLAHAQTGTGVDAFSHRLFIRRYSLSHFIFFSFAAHKTRTNWLHKWSQRTNRRRWQYRQLPPKQDKNMKKKKEKRKKDVHSFGPAELITGIRPQTERILHARSFES